MFVQLNTCGVVCGSVLQRGHSGDGCMTLFKYERSRRYLFVLSWARVRRVARRSVVSELCILAFCVSFFCIVLMSGWVLCIRFFRSSDSVYVDLKYDDVFLLWLIVVCEWVADGLFVMGSCVVVTFCVDV